MKLNSVEIKEMAIKEKEIYKNNSQNVLPPENINVSVNENNVGFLYARKCAENNKLEYFRCLGDRLLLFRSNKTNKDIILFYNTDFSGLIKITQERNIIRVYYWRAIFASKKYIIELNVETGKKKKKKLPDSYEFELQY